MATATKTTKTFSLDKEVLREVERTKGAGRSTSERVNELLKAGLAVERQKCLHSEAAAFFKSEQGHEERASRKAFMSASVKSISRE